MCGQHRLQLLTLYSVHKLRSNRQVSLGYSLIGIASPPKQFKVVQKSRSSKNSRSYLVLQSRNDSAGCRISCERCLSQCLFSPLRNLVQYPPGCLLARCTPISWRDSLPQSATSSLLSKCQGSRLTRLCMTSAFSVSFLTSLLSRLTSRVW